MSGTGESWGITAPFLGSVDISQCDVAAPFRGDDNPTVRELVIAHLHSLLPSALCHAEGFWWLLSLSAGIWELQNPNWAGPWQPDLVTLVIIFTVNWTWLSPWFTARFCRKNFRYFPGVMADGLAILRTFCLFPLLWSSRSFREQL